MATLFKVFNPFPILFKVFKAVPIVFKPMAILFKEFNPWIRVSKLLFQYQCNMTQCSHYLWHLPLFLNWAIGFNLTWLTFKFWVAKPIPTPALAEAILLISLKQNELQNIVGV